MANRSVIVDVIAHTCSEAADVQTVAQLAALSGMKVRTLERRCAASGITAKALLDFVRCMKAVLDNDPEWSGANLFPELDPRTSGRLCRFAGLSSVKPSATDFIRRQSFIRNPRLLNELLAHFQSN